MKSKRYAEINKDVCVSCGSCMVACPRDAVCIIEGCFAKADEGSCVGCGLCAKVCPVGCINIKEREA